MPKLHSIPYIARLGIACMILALLAGLAAGAQHLVWHHEDRDERPGFSLSDVRGAYHGIQSRAPMIIALERNHPPELGAAARDTLLAWLNSGRINEDYDNLDLGDMAPQEIIATSCLACHARNAAIGDGIGRRIPLEFFDDVRKVAFSRDVQPNDSKIMAASTHAHAATLGVLLLAAAALGYMSRLPCGVVSVATLVMGAGLAIDLACWWIAPRFAPAVWGIVGGGAAFMGASGLLLTAVLVDLLIPAGRAGAATR